MGGDGKGRRTAGGVSTAPPLEDYAILGNGRNALLVSRDGSIDWWCAPRFDSDAWFAALLGTPEHGRWRVGPAHAPRRTRRAYREGTVVLETVHELDEGVLAVVDGMPDAGEAPTIVRVAECREGRVAVEVELAPVFHYGRVQPAVHRTDDGWAFVAGPSALRLRTGAQLRRHGRSVRGRVELRAGERVAFALAHHASHLAPPPPLDAAAALAAAEAGWRAFSARVRVSGPWRAAVLRSLLTVRALTYGPTGAVTAALTAGLPERPGGRRNWDYRYTWLRDSTFTFYALLSAGLRDEARAWRDFLLRAAADDPARVQTLYRVEGERRASEWEVDWLPGYAGSRPVRIGNAAFTQRQMDVSGEVVDCLSSARAEGIEDGEDAWRLERGFAEEVASSWREPDDGLWEIRTGRRHFVTSKVLAWVALDRAVRDAERRGAEAPLDRWRAARREIHEEVCRRGYHPGRRAFTLSYGSDALDGGALLLPLVGFLPASDPRVVATIETIRRELVHGGLVLRYRTDEVDDGLPPGEGAFLPCTLWLADCLALLGRKDEAREAFERVLEVRNDVGLLSEEYDVDAGRLVGNFPQAITHVAVVNTAANLSEGGGPAHVRGLR